MIIIYDTVYQQLKYATKKLTFKKKIGPHYVAQSYLKVLETSSFENSEPEKYLYHPASWELPLFR